jgi:hypothetical protein
MPSAPSSVFESEPSKVFLLFVEKALTLPSYSEREDAVFLSMGRKRMEELLASVFSTFMRRMKGAGPLRVNIPSIDIFMEKLREVRKEEDPDRTCMKDPASSLVFCEKVCRIAFLHFDSGRYVDFRDDNLYPSDSVSSVDRGEREDREEASDIVITR